MEAYAAFDADVKLLPQWVQIWMDILGLVPGGFHGLPAGWKADPGRWPLYADKHGRHCDHHGLHARAIGHGAPAGRCAYRFLDTAGPLPVAALENQSPPPRAISGRRHDSPDDCLLCRADLRLLRCHPLDFGPAGARRLTQVLFFWRVARNGFAAKGRMTAHILWWKAGLVAQHFSSMPGPARIV